MKSSIAVVALCGGICASIVACGGTDGEQPDNTNDEVGDLQLALTAVPVGVTCIQVVVHSAPGGVPTGAPIATQNFAATPGAPWSASAMLGTFTMGRIQVSGSAYTVACASVTATMQPAWMADAVLLDRKPGVPLVTALTFRENLPVSVTGNFAPSISSMAVGSTSALLLLENGSMRPAWSSPIQAPVGLTNVIEIVSGTNHACARKTDGTVWCWGANTFGQLGNGTTTSSPTTPVQVSGITGATRLAAGDSSSCAIAGGTCYCWGDNSNGQIGDGTTTNKLVPMFTGGTQIRAMDISMTHACFIALDGAIRCSGLNTFGQLGNGTTTNSLSTVPVTSGTFVDVAVSRGGSAGGHSCAVNAVGNVYCWGKNNVGQLGNESITNSWVPNLVQVGSAGVDVTLGVEHTCLLRKDGRVNCWGANAAGQLGTGIGPYATSPAFAAGLDWGVTSVGATNYGTCALRADATVWCWGFPYSVATAAPIVFTPTQLSL